MLLPLLAVWLPLAVAAPSTPSTDPPVEPHSLVASEPASAVPASEADVPDAELAEWWKRPGTLVIESVQTGGSTDDPTKDPAAMPGPQP